MRHIKEAEALSKRLGGMDEEVKSFFFNLDPARRSDVLRRYGKKFGQDKEDYAREAFPYWKSGERRMSGLVAGRLFDLLPPIMPMDLKLNIVEGLFESAGRKREDYVLVPMEAEPHEIVAFVDRTCFGYLADVGIDETVKEQFDWLSGEDADVAEKLFKHAMQVTYDAKKAASEAMLSQLDQELYEHGDTIQEITSTIQLRQHQVHIKRTEAVEEPRTVDRLTFNRGGHEPKSSWDRISPVFWWVAGGLLFLLLLSL